GGGADVGAELLGRDRHEDRPIAEREAEEAAGRVEEPARRAVHRAVEDDRERGEREEGADGLLATPEDLAQHARGEVTHGEARVADGDGRRGLDDVGHAELPGEVERLRDEDPHAEPEREADGDAGEVAEEPLGRPEEHEEVPAGDLALLLHGGEDLALAEADPEEQERDAERAADEIGRTPVDEVADDAAEDGAAHAHAGDDRRAVAADLLGERLAHEGDGGAELTCEAEARDEADVAVDLDVVDESVRDVGEGVERDRPEEDAPAAELVAEDTPEDAAEQHPDHLP